MLSCRELTCARGDRTVLQGIDIDLHAGEVLGVLGANGAGKSTMLGTLAGELVLTGGTLTLDAAPLARWSAQSLARRRAVLPQSPSLAFDLSVREVVEMGAYPFPEADAADVAARMEQVLALADATSLRDRRYLGISGGEQQRVQFARALLQALTGLAHGEYRVLFLDEPTSSLDPRHQLLLLRAVRTLARSAGLAVLVVLHDVNLAARWCDRLLLLAGGHAIAQGAPADILVPETLTRVYGLHAQVALIEGYPAVTFRLD